MTEKFNIKLIDFDLSNKEKNALIKNNIDYMNIRDFLLTEPEEFLKLRGWGPKTYYKIVDTIKSFGLLHTTKEFDDCFGPIVRSTEAYKLGFKRGFSHCKSLVNKIKYKG